MTKRKATMFSGILPCLLFVLYSYSSAAWGGVLFEKHFGEAAKNAGKQVEGSYVDGYRPKTVQSKETGQPLGVDPVDYPVALGKQLNPSSGSMVFRLKYIIPRDINNHADVYASDTLFILMDSKGKYLADAKLMMGAAAPEPWIGAGLGGITFFGTTDMPISLWGTWIPLNRQIKPGESFAITFTWDNGVNQVYLNDTVLHDHYTVPWDNNSRVNGKGNFGNYLKDVKTLRIGTDNEVNNSPLQSSSVESVEIYDRPFVPSKEKPLIASVTDDSFKIPGISGKLVAGETVTTTLVAVPGGKASFDLGRVKGIAMSELPVDAGGPGKPPVAAGTYRGSYTIKPGDDFAEGYIAGQFVSGDNVAAEPVTSKAKWTIETKPVVSFSIANKDLPADLGTKSRIKLVAKDANGNPLKGRNLKLTLSTTDEYTGTVGAGDFGKQVGASVETRWKGATDAWGEVEFDYVAGFAAKTVILQAKDLDSGGVSVDYITAYKEASIDIALTAPRSMAAARRGLQYTIKVEASRTQLTADGKSRSVIRATVTDPGGKPVPGDTVIFALSSANGTLRTIVGVTDAGGVATAEYIAGKKIGIVVISATDTIRNISGNVSILLLSDAPAKIILKARPESLPADGNSKADIQVKVTDINDNPNKDTKVEFKMKQGSGKLDYADRTTDTFGDALNRFTAGTTPGIATILATVRSKVPTAAELLKAKNVLFVPYNEASESIRVEKWLKKKGDTVLVGEPIVSYTVGRKSDIQTINAPYDLTMGETLIEYWDNAEVGQTLATVVPVIK